MCLTALAGANRFLHTHVRSERAEVHSGIRPDVIKAQLYDNCDWLRLGHAFAWPQNVLKFYTQITAQEPARPAFGAIEHGGILTTIPSTLRCVFE